MDLFPLPMAKHTSDTPLLSLFRRVRAWLYVLSDLFVITVINNTSGELTGCIFWGEKRQKSVLSTSDSIPIIIIFLGLIQAFITANRNNIGAKLFVLKWKDTHSIQGRKTIEYKQFCVCVCVLQPLIMHVVWASCLFTTLCRFCCVYFQYWLRCERLRRVWVS